jgi:hypothetical protein
MAIGDSKEFIAERLERNLTKEGEGQLDGAMARRIAQAVADVIEQNNLQAELRIRQSLQVSGLIV